MGTLTMSLGLLRMKIMGWFLFPLLTLLYLLFINKCVLLLSQGRKFFFLREVGKILATNKIFFSFFFLSFNCHLHQEAFLPHLGRGSDFLLSAPGRIELSL